MTDTALQIKNPSVTLYAFHLCQDLTQEPGQLRQDADQLWQNCANLSEPLAIPDLKSFPEKIQSHSAQAPITSRYVQLLPGDGRLTYTPPLQIEGSALQVEVYPLQIHDTYALDLTLYCQNVTVAASQFSHLNPQGCLLASNIRASLGQTLVLYGSPVGNPQKDRELADACVDAFLQGTNQKRPFFSASGQLFGSPIFEYDNGEEKPSEQCHILVWLNRHPETLNLAQKTYLSFLNLLCCRSKILFAYHEARYCYRQTRGLYGSLEQEVQLFKELPTDPGERLQQLKQQLTQIPPQMFEYGRYLRDIEDHKTAIATNAQNYDYWLGKIRESSLEGDDLEFLENFLNQRSQQFQNQIQVDLSYLTPGQQLFEQMLGTIRGIVEIEQAESDRALEETLRKKEEAADKREKSLELWIALVGTGLAVSGISAQTDAKPVETILIGRLEPNQTLDCPDAGMGICLEYYSYYIVIHILVGAIAASILGLIIWLISKKKSTKQSIPTTLENNALLKIIMSEKTSNSDFDRDEDKTEQTAIIANKKTPTNDLILRDEFIREVLQIGLQQNPNRFKRIVKSIGLLLEDSNPDPEIVKIKQKTDIQKQAVYCGTFVTSISVFGAILLAIMSIEVIPILALLSLGSACAGATFVVAGGGVPKQKSFADNISQSSQLQTKSQKEEEN